jgi:hypothetical protein
MFSDSRCSTQGLIKGTIFFAEKKSIKQINKKETFILIIVQFFN